MRAQFADKADIEIHFQPFQLYPDLPKGGSNQGVDKTQYFAEMRAMRARRTGQPEKTEEERAKSRQWLKDQWAMEGLELNTGLGGRWGNSADAQRMIMWARDQGLEDEMIEGIYSANHVHNLPLSEWSVLLDAAEKAGVTGAGEMLKSNWGKAEHAEKVQNYIDMGIHAVPVIVINDKYPIHGAPDKELLADCFTQLLEKDTISARLPGNRYF